MDDRFQHVLSTVEPLHDFDDFIGPLYRCALTLRDGTYLPCAVLQSEARLIQFAKDQMDAALGGAYDAFSIPNHYDSLLRMYIAWQTRVGSYDIESATVSPFATPLHLLQALHEETAMAWTGWVFEMHDGKLFGYGSSGDRYFVDLPEGYSFDDVAIVHPHSYLRDDGTMAKLQLGGPQPVDYDRSKIRRSRIYFSCCIDLG